MLYKAEGIVLDRKCYATRNLRPTLPPSTKFIDVLIRSTVLGFGKEKKGKSIGFVVPWRRIDVTMTSVFSIFPLVIVVDLLCSFYCSAFNALRSCQGGGYGLYFLYEVTVLYYIKDGDKNRRTGSYSKFSLHCALVWNLPWQYVQAVSLINYPEVQGWVLVKFVIQQHRVLASCLFTRVSLSC